MNDIIIARHKTWGLTEEGLSLTEIATKMGAEVADLEIVRTESPDVRALREVPSEFRGTLLCMAHARGHSAGADEVLMILGNLAADLLPAIREFEKRIRMETQS